MNSVVFLQGSIMDLQALRDCKVSCTLDKHNIKLQDYTPYSFENQSYGNSLSVSKKALMRSGLTSCDESHRLSDGCSEPMS